MDVRALVYAPEFGTVAELRRVFGIVGLDMELAPDVPTALDRFRREHFDCVVIDCDRAPLDTVARLRVGPGRAMAIFALVGDRHAMRKAYEDGATFTLDKPLNPERTLRCIRAAYGLVVGERRRYERHPLELTVQMKSGAGEDTASMVNLSSGGMCLRLSRPLPEQAKVKVAVHLPEVAHNFRATCELVWSKGEQAGFKFTNVGHSHRDALAAWLALQSEVAKVVQ
jgi:CheY-like chemotaxis protein